MTTEITSYTELIGAIQAKVERWNVRQVDFDELAGFAPGLSGKVFGMLQVRTLRLEKLFDALRAAGMRLYAEDDPEQEAKMLARIADNFNPRLAYQSRRGHSASLPSTPVLNRVMQPWRKIGGKKRWARKTKKEISDHMRMMAMAKAKKDRKRRKAAQQRRMKERAKANAAPGHI